MALSDPLVAKISGVDASHNRVDTGGGRSVYRLADGTATITVSHSSGKRNRTAIRIDREKLAADPFVPAVNQSVSMSVTLVVDSPKAGYSNSERGDAIDTLVDLITRGSGANRTKIIGGES